MTSVWSHLVPQFGTPIQVPIHLLLAEMIGMPWLAVQGLLVPIAISSLVVLIIVAVIRTILQMKGDDAMGNRIKGIINTILDLIYTMSANIAGGALLAKTVQSIIPATSDGQY